MNMFQAQNETEDFIIFSWTVNIAKHNTIKAIECKDE